MQVEYVEGGVIILGSFPDPEVLQVIKETAGLLPLIIADPPYGNIVSNAWDRVPADAPAFVRWMNGWTQQCYDLSLPGAALYIWGGIGIPRFRPFYLYAAGIEHETRYTISNHITWSKKRAYGVQHNYLFTREELLYLVKGDPRRPRVFNVPLLEEKRGYAGYNAKYPAKSDFKRRTNVWTDVTEIFKGKVHIAQKPDRLHEIIIETSSVAGDWVLDPFAGSGTTGRAARKTKRKFILVENDPKSFQLCLDSLRG